MSVGLKLMASLVRLGSTSSLRDIERGMFVGDDEQRMFDYVRNHYRRYSELPALQTIATDLGITIPRSPETVDYYLQEVRNRSMYNALTPLYNDLHNPLVNGDMDEVRSLIMQMHSSVRVSTPNDSDQNLDDVVDRTLTIVENRRSSPGLSGMHTGWGTLDIETDGYQNGDLIIWAARPGVGKTHLLIHQARTAFHAGASVLFVSMEMTLEQITMRLLAHEAGLDPNMVRRGNLSEWAMESLEEARGRLVGQDRFTLYGGNMSRDIDALDATIQERNPDLICIDGIYLLKPRRSTSRGTKDKYQNVSYVIDDLKEMTLTRDRPFVTTTQFNRMGRDRPSLETLGFTDTMAMHASLILAVQHYGEGRRPRYRKVSILKGREGEATEFGLNYSFTPVDFSETSLPDIETPSRNNDPEGHNLDLQGEASMGDYYEN